MGELSVNPLPQNLFPSFGTQPGRLFSPARLVHLQVLGSISAPHHSVVRGHPYSCRTVQGAHGPGAIPHNDEALFEPDVSSLLFLTSSPLALPSVSPPSPSLPTRQLFSSVSPTHRLCCRSKLSLPLPHFFSTDTFYMFVHTIPSPFLPLPHSLIQHTPPDFCL